MKKSVLWLAAALLAGIFSSCHQDKDEVQTYTYEIRLTESRPYLMERVLAQDTLVEDILSAMPFDRDTLETAVRMEGSDVNVCDSLVRQAFRTACDRIDAERYCGRYVLKLGRWNSPEDLTLVDSAAFEAAAENVPGIMDGDGRWVSTAKNEYIYDMAVSSHSKSGPAMNYLYNAGYIVCTHNLNESADGKYVYVGVKKAVGDYVTDIEDEVQDEEGELRTVRLTAREAALSYALVSYDNVQPAAFYGPYSGNEDLSDFVFRQVKRLGDSNGDLNQDAGGKWIFLWISRDFNSEYVISGFGGDYYSSSRDDGSILHGVQLKKGSDASCMESYIVEQHADCNRGSGTCWGGSKYSYLMMERIRTSKKE